MQGKLNLLTWPINGKTHQLPQKYPTHKIEKQPIYFALKKVISPRFYKGKIKTKSITKEEAVNQILEILDIALMIRYQETDEFESLLRGLDNGRPSC